MKINYIRLHKNNNNSFAKAFRQYLNSKATDSIYVPLLFCSLVSTFYNPVRIYTKG